MGCRFCEKNPSNEYRYQPEDDENTAHENGHPNGGVPGMIEDGPRELVTRGAIYEADREDQWEHVPELGGQKGGGE
jgi:hypothetical protein